MYGPVRTVVWQGSAGDRRPYADHRRHVGRCPALKNAPPPNTQDCAARLARRPGRDDLRVAVIVVGKASEKLSGSGAGSAEADTAEAREVARHAKPRPAR